jgi:hypothetical protein
MESARTGSGGGGGGGGCDGCGGCGGAMSASGQVNTLKVCVCVCVYVCVKLTLYSKAGEVGDRIIL